jgi:hypothetical protein
MTWNLCRAAMIEFMIIYDPVQRLTRFVPSFIEVWVSLYIGL